MDNCQQSSRVVHLVAQYKKDIEEADNWVQKTLATQKKNAEKKAAAAASGAKTQ